MEPFADMKQKKYFSQKGQATIEFLLILIVSLAYIVTIIQPNADIASSSINDVANIAKLRVAAEKIVNSVQYASISGTGTKQTIEITVPANGEILCEVTLPAKIRIKYQMNSAEGTVACLNDEDAATDADFCNRSIQTGTGFSCTLAGVALTGPVTPGIYLVTTEKTSTGIKVDFSVVR